MTRPVVPTGSARPLGLIVVGCGRVFQRYHLPAILADSRVRPVGMVETDPARRAWAADALPGVPCAGSLSEARRAADAADADAVLIATPPPTHAALTEAALGAGLSVLVEKPMAVSLEEARRVRGLARRSGRVLRVGFNRRYRADYAGLRERAGLRASHVRFTFVAESGRWSAGEAPAVPFVLHDAGSHAVDLVAHVGGRRIERVRARAEDGAGARAVRVDAELADGARATCTVGHGSRYREELAVSAGGREDRVTVAPNRLGWARLALRRLAGRPTAADHSFRAQLAGFVAACRSEPDAVGADADDGLASVAVIEAALRSLETGGGWCPVTENLTQIEQDA